MHGKEKYMIMLWLENLMGRDHLEDMGLDGKIIIEWT
jgi:hypothetical protein